MNNIFVSTDCNTDDNISGKMTYTNVMEIIPEGYVTERVLNWSKNYKTEWRWRFLKFNNRFVVEVSYLNSCNVLDRYYCNKYGQWINNVDADTNYDKYVVEIYYVYTNE